MTLAESSLKVIERKKIGDRYDASVRCHCQHGSLADVETQRSSSRSNHVSLITIAVYSLFLPFRKYVTYVSM